MKITLTNQEMLDSVEAMLSSKETGKLGYALAKNLRRLLAELPEYLKVREDLMKQYGTPTVRGSFTFTPEQAASFNEAIQEYADMTTELDLMTVPTDLFIGGGLTAQQMYHLYWMEERGK